MSLVPESLKNFGRTPFGFGNKDGNVYAKEGDMDLRATGRMISNEQLSAPKKGPPTEMMVLTFLGNGEEWVLADKYSSGVSPGESTELLSGFSQSPVVIDQYGTHTKPQAIAAAIAKTTLLSNKAEGAIVRDQIKKLYNNPTTFTAGTTTKPKSSGAVKTTRGGGKRAKHVNTEKAKRSNMRRSMKRNL